jgi:hypothetical protein
MGSRADKENTHSNDACIVRINSTTITAAKQAALSTAAAADLPLRVLI